MEVKVSFKQVGSSDALRNYAREKSEKLATYFQGKISVTWNFSVEKQDHVTHCHLVGNNMDYFAEASSEDMYASVDLCIDKVEKQLRKHKEIVTDHLHRQRDRKTGS